MNLVLALYLLVLRPTGLLCYTTKTRASPIDPAASESLSASLEPQQSLEHTKSVSKTRKNIAEFLLPIIDTSFPSDFRPVNLKKSIKVLPIIESNEQSSSRPNLNSHKKHIVEITPLRNKGHDFQPLAYILSPELSRGHGKNMDKTHKIRDYHDHIGYFVKKISPIDVSESSEKTLDGHSNERKHISKEITMSSNFSDNFLYKTFNSSNEEGNALVSTDVFDSDESQLSSEHSRALDSTLSISLENDTSDYDSVTDISTLISSLSENVDSNSASNIIDSDGTDSSEILSSEYESSNISAEQSDSGHKYTEMIHEGNDSSMDINTRLSGDILESKLATQKQGHALNIRRMKEHNYNQFQKGITKSHRKIYNSVETGVSYTEKYGDEQLNDLISSESRDEFLPEKQMYMGNDMGYRLKTSAQGSIHTPSYNYNHSYINKTLEESSPKRQYSKDRYLHENEYPKTHKYLEVVAVIKNQNFDNGKNLEKTNSNIIKSKLQNEGQDAKSSDINQYGSLRDNSDNIFDRYKFSKEAHDNSSIKKYESPFGFSNIKDITEDILNINENNNSDGLNRYLDNTIKTNISIEKLENSDRYIEVDDNDLYENDQNIISETKMTRRGHEDVTNGEEALIDNHNQEDTLAINIKQNVVSDEENVNTEKQTELKSKSEFSRRDLQYPIVKKNSTCFTNILKQTAVKKTPTNAHGNEKIITREKNNVDKSWLILASNGMELTPSSTESSERASMECCDKQLMKDHLDNPGYQHKAYRLSFLFNK